MLAFLKDGSSFGIRQDDVELVGLIWKSTVIEEYIGPFLAAHLSSNTDGLAMRHFRCKQWRRVRIWWQKCMGPMQGRNVAWPHVIYK
jgi:hypothetical protein